MKRVILFVIAFIFFFANQNLFAAFIDGVERFNGTSKDTTTWEEYSPMDPILQDGELIFDSIRGDYTTKILTIDPGETVSVELTELSVTDLSGPKYTSLFLTSNSEGTGESTWFDSSYFSITCETDYFGSSVTFYSYVGGSGIATGSLIGTYLQSYPLPTEESPYYLQIERTLEYSLELSVFYSDMSLLGSRTIGIGSDELYISLETAWGVRSVFDNVAITPEPCTVLLFGLGGSFLRRRKR